MPKGCLKRASTSLPSMSSMSNSDQDAQPLRRPTCCRKHVSFLEEGVAEVHVADEWDRTPVEMCSKLSYHDILELKEMQMQMARVNRKAHSINFPKILSAVPVGLMPLLPETPAPSPIHSPPMSPSNSTTMNMVRPPSPPATPPRPAPSSIPAPNPPRMKTFAFLPLLDTPPDSKPSPPQPPASCPPTTKLPARTTMQMVPPSPPSEAESSAKAPSVSYFPPQPKANGSNLAPPQASSSSSVVQQHNITLHNPNVRKVRLQPLRSPALNPPSPFSLYPPSPRDSSDSDSEMEHYHSSTSSNANTKEFVLDLADLRSRREAMRLRQEREEARTWEPCNTLHFGPMDGL